MPQTIAEAQQRSNNVQERGVFEIIINEGPFLAMIPFQEFNGNGLTYLRELTLATVDMHDPNDTWTEDTPKTTPVTANLKIMGGDSDLDKFLERTLSNVNNQRAIDLAGKLKAMVRKANDQNVYGDEDNDAKEWDGLHDFLQSNTGQVVEQGSGSSPAALNITNLRAMSRKVLGGPISAYLLSRTLVDGLTAYYENSMNAAMLTLDLFGMKVRTWDGVPLFGTDYLVDTETISGGSFSVKTGSTGTSIFAVRFGMDGLHGIQNGGIEVIPIFQLETKDASRFRVRWYVNPIVIKSTKSVAGITGILATGTVAD